MTNNQVSGSQTIKRQTLKSFLQQIEMISAQLQTNVRDKITPLLNEVSKDTFDDGETHSRPSSIKAICEGASSNSVAQVIVSVIAALIQLMHLSSDDKRNTARFAVCAYQPFVPRAASGKVSSSRSRSAMQCCPELG